MPGENPRSRRGTANPAHILPRLAWEQTHLGKNWGKETKKGEGEKGWGWGWWDRASETVHRLLPGVEAGRIVERRVFLPLRHSVLKVSLNVLKTN